MRRNVWLASGILTGALMCASRATPAQSSGQVAARPPVDRLEGFYKRKATGNGTFIGPEELAKHPVARTSDLLRLIPGVRVSTHASAATPVTSTHCTGIGYFIDGILAHGFNPIDTINADDLLAIEVYKSPAQIPAQFQGDFCSAILLWTKGG